MLVYERVILVEKPTKILSAIQVETKKSHISENQFFLQTDKGHYKAGDLVKLRLLIHDNFLRKGADFLFRFLTKTSKII